MGKSTQLFLLISALIFVVAAQVEACPKNQVFTTCGTHCPPTCLERGLRPCIKMCYIGCQCKPGYVLNANNECIKPSQC